MIFLGVLLVLVLVFVGFGVLTWFVAKALIIIVVGGLFLLGVMLFSGDPNLVGVAWGIIALLVLLGLISAGGKEGK